MVTIQGPKFRSAKINPNRKLGFKYNRKLPFGKKGAIFRKAGINFRKHGVKFREGGMLGIELSKDENPIKLNNIGIKYYNKGKYKSALNYFNKALSIAPGFEEAKKNRIYAIQMIRQNRAAEVAKRYKETTRGAMPWQSTDSREAIEVRPLDYSATRFSEFHQYGRIQHKDDHQNQLSWGQVRR